MDQWCVSEGGVVCGRGGRDVCGEVGIVILAVMSNVEGSR